MWCDKLRGVISRIFFVCHNIFVQELEIYNYTLLKRPAILAINKMDVENSEVLLKEFEEKMRNWKGE